MSDELIMNTASWLTSFKAVRNEAGEGNNVFDRAIDASLDLSSIMGGDMQGAATQLGKALQDPVKGVSALGRAGVQFSDDQKAAIASFVESNNLLGAQRIILSEVEGQVGGAAEAMADPLDKAGAAVGELSESVGNELMPMLNSVVDNAFVPFVEGATDMVPRIGDALGSIDDRVGEFSQGVRDRWNEVSGSTRETWDGAVAFVGGIPDRIGGALGGFVERVSGIASLGWEGWGARTREWVDAGLAFVSTIPERTVSFLSGLPERLGGMASTAWQWFRDASAGRIGEFLGWVGGIPDRVGSFLTGLPERLRRIGSDMIQGLINGARAMASTAWDAITGVVTGPVDFLRGFFGGGRAAPPPSPGRRQHGGPVAAGRPYIVGEREAELFVPGQNGQILNQRQIARAGLGGGSDRDLLLDLIGATQENTAVLRGELRRQSREAMVQSRQGVLV